MGEWLGDSGYAALMKFGNNLDCADNRLVERNQIFRGNPVFQMRRAACFLDTVIVQEAALHLETSDKAAATGWDIPVASNLHSIILRKDRIKDRLIREPWREGSHVCFLD